MSSQTSTDHAARATSPDGTTIAFEAFGHGPAAVIVGGAFCDRGAFRPLAQALGEQGFTGVTYDRRGRGDSSDTQPYAVQREIDDLAAVIEAARGASDSGADSRNDPAYAHGISSGGALVLEAVAAGAPITKASALEVPYRTPGWPPAPEDYIATLERLEAAGDREGIVHYFHTRVVGLPEGMLGGMKGSPMWDALLAMAPTVRYDALCMGGDDQSLRRDRLANVTVPFLSINSSGTAMPWLHEAPAVLAEALPRGSHRELEGGFHEVPPEVMAPALAEFYRV